MTSLVESLRTLDATELRDWSSVTRVCEVLFWTGVEEKRVRLRPVEPLGLFLRCGKELASKADDLSAIPRSLWSFATYATFRRSLRAASNQGSQSEAVDEWILSSDSRSAQLVFLAAVPSVVSGVNRVGNVFRWTREAYPGHTILDAHRERLAGIYADDSAFADAFSASGGGVLAGLDWTNVVAAGGAVASALHYDFGEPRVLRPDKHADIDLFLYAVSPGDAERKIAHIWDTYCDNLPLTAPRLVVRNSQTITFYSSYDVKRVQIVLKIAPSAAAVLDNFDLDVCAVAWDGSRVLMSPRFCRALETGYNTFTMDIVVGHFLGQRRESRLQRITKYASRGYGIRFLPKYCEGTDFEAISAAAEEMVRSIVAYERGIVPRSQLKIPFRRIHGARNPLSSLALFLRHVFLWDMAQRHNVGLAVFSEATDHDGDEASSRRHTLNNIASCVWDSHFDVGKLSKHIDTINGRRADATLGGLARARPDLEQNLGASWPIYRKIYQSKGTLYGGELAEVWTERSPSFVVALPRRLADFIASALGQVISPRHSDATAEEFPPLTFPLKEIDGTEGLPLLDDETGLDVLALYRCTLLPEMAWELHDERRDEAFFILDTFRRLPWGFLETLDGRAQVWVLARLLRRIPRVDWTAERVCFNRWCIADPISSVPYHGVNMKGARSLVAPGSD
ncbi:hypothetical protein MKEN_00986200 [Mycena kentingensis (nom. inval.)]|nr:hypothetical protein MKEN_00986200 [Mycena kentingensis (nom. inval.)]